MKKLLCFLLCLTLIFSSVSLSFATATDWDTSDQANLRAIKNLLDSGGGIYNMISTISTRLNTISNTLNDIKGYLFDDNHSIAYWTSAISTWMSPIYNSLTSTPVDLQTIINALTIHTTTSSGTTYISRITDAFDLKYGYIGLNDNNPSGAGQWITLYGLNGDGSMSGLGLFARNSNLLGILPYYLRLITNNSAIMGNIMNTELKHIDLDYNSPQTAINWLTLQNTSFTPSSSTTGIYTWLKNIQDPVARLSYVLASDERIEAQEAAAANEEAVVDNFIDSSGNGAASLSDIGSMSGLSSGYKQNFGSDASPSGIFDIFNSDHATWFSQETKNQLDTTTPSRMIKGSVSETPLLDKQIKDIYDALGVKQP